MGMAEPVSLLLALESGSEKTARTPDRFPEWTPFRSWLTRRVPPCPLEKAQPARLNRKWANAPWFAASGERIATRA